MNIRVNSPMKIKKNNKLLIKYLFFFTISFFVTVILFKRSEKQIEIDAVEEFQPFELHLYEDSDDEANDIQHNQRMNDKPNSAESGRHNGKEDEFAMDIEKPLNAIDAQVNDVAVGDDVIVITERQRTNPTAPATSPPAPSSSPTMPPTTPLAIIIPAKENLTTIAKPPQETTAKISPASGTTKDAQMNKNPEKTDLFLDVQHDAFIKNFWDDKTKNVNKLKRDWHDYAFMEYERNRRGFGENGKGESFDNKTMNETASDMLYKVNGFNAVISDRIALNRSVPDIRHKGCFNKTYLIDLPTVSVIIPVYDEHLSTLLRSIYSIVNRSPKELIVEIIVVDDCSTKDILKDELNEHVKNFLPIVKIIRLPRRSGLIVARSEGARKATGDVLVFLDSHIEANTNWLPPLLEPIAEDYRVCVCPFIDVVSFESFAYRSQDEGKRGAFDWQFLYRRMPLLPEDLARPTEPFASPVMAGGLFAISAKFFWELGGYDEGLDIWGGEQYELSFKIWQCGGSMVDAPCSRVGHIYRGLSPFPNPRGIDFVANNFKRVAEVWMDEYKEYIYARHPDRYKKADAGDISQQVALRERLQCKPFKWFMENVAFDLIDRFKVVDPPPFTYGTIQSMANKNLCLDTLGHGKRQPVGLYGCSADKLEPQANQYFALSFYRDIRMREGIMCLDAQANPKTKVLLYGCHYAQGNQMWRYNMTTNQIILGRSSMCMEMDEKTQDVFVNVCNPTDLHQKWEWAFVNATYLNDWEKAGAKYL